MRRVSPAKLRRAAKLLGEGQSIRQTALRCSLGTMSIVRVKAALDREAAPPATARCPACGATILADTACRACLTPRRTSKEALRARLARLREQLGPLGLELRPHHEGRYLEVRRKRREAERSDKPAA